MRAVSGGSSLSPGMKLTASVPSDLSHPSSFPLLSPADWGCCCMWVGGVELPALGSITKRFSRACYLLLSCFLTVTLVGREGRRQVTWHVLRAFPCGVCHVASIVYSDSCSFVYGFVLCCEMVMAPWQSFIYLQDA